MKYARAAWKSERAGWRSVIQLNLIHSIITIVETLQREVDGDHLDDMSDDENIGTDAFHEPTFTLTEKHRLLKLRLGPLRRVEADLKKHLGASSEDFSSRPMQATPFDAPSMRTGSPPPFMRRANEFVVRSWKDALKPSMSRATHAGQTREKPDSDEATEVIAGCREDMKALWEDETVQTVLKKRKLQLDESAGLYVKGLILLCRC
jgi:guanine nucleotide-binding protein subunit alpha